MRSRTPGGRSFPPAQACRAAALAGAAALVWLALAPGMAGAAPSSARKQDGVPRGTFKLTFYYLPEQRAPGSWPVYGPGCGEVLALTDKEFHDALALEGSGRAMDGRVLNFEERCSCALPGPRGTAHCYTVLREEDYPWGRGAYWQGHYFRLEPFRSLATDPLRLPLGTAVYVPELAQVLLPDGRRSTGCFRAEDTGSGVGRRQLDLFVGRPDWYRRAQQSLPAQVTVIAGSKRCARLLR